MTARSAALLAAGLWVGCLAAGPWWLTLTGIFALMAVSVGPASGRLIPRWRLLISALAMVAVGAGLTGARHDLVAHAALAELADHGGSAELTATAVTEPRETTHGAWQVLRVADVADQHVRERAAVTWPSLDSAPELGATVRLTATARPLDGAGFDRHLRSLHAVVAIDPVSEAQSVSAPSWPIRSTATVRQRLRSAAWRGLPDHHAPLLTGIVTGDRTGQEAALTDDLRASGLIHLVVVSGKHVALLLGGVLAITTALRMPMRTRVLIALGVLIWFVVLTRWQPSVLRAGTMAGLAMGATLIGRPADTRHTLSMVVLVLLLIDPFLAVQLGFILSVSATVGVLLIAPWLADRLRGPAWLRFLLGAAVGAQLGVTPVLLGLDGAVPTGAVPANLIAVPAAAVAQAIGIVTAAVAQLDVTVAAWVAGAARPFITVILWAARTFSGSPEFIVAHLLSPLALFLPAVVLLWPRAPRIAAVGLAIVTVLVVTPRFTAAPDVTALTVTSFDVGQADATLVEAPHASGTARMLVDGGLDDDDVLAFLRDRGIRHLDVVLLTHAHADHSNGLPAVLSTLQVGVFITGPAEPDDAWAHSAVEAERVAAANGAAIVRVHAGQQMSFGDTLVEVVSPPNGNELPDDLNEQSVVIRVGGPEGVLLTGDAETAAQAHMLQRPHLLRAGILKVPHHGANTNADGFIPAVGAHTALISVGADNDYGHPHPEVLADLENATVLRTDRDGTVTVETPDDAPGGVDSSVHHRLVRTGASAAVAAVTRSTIDGSGLDGSVSVPLAVPQGAVISSADLPVSVPAACTAAPSATNSSASGSRIGRPDAATTTSRQHWPRAPPPRRTIGVVEVTYAVRAAHTSRDADQISMPTSTAC